VDDISELRDMGSAATCSKSHHRALFEGPKAEVVRDQGVEHSERVKELAPPTALKLILAANVGAGRRYVAIAVHDQHRGLFEWRNKEDRSMGIVMAHFDYGW
jgi:hypothetical protein